MDPTTPLGELLFSIFETFVQYERVLTREQLMGAARCPTPGQAKGNGRRRS